MLHRTLLLTCIFSSFFTTSFSPGIPEAKTLQVKLELVARGLTSPVGMASPADGTHRLFIQEQPGRIRIIKNGQMLAEPFLDLTAKIGSLNPAYSEKGLLGLAFHPGYKTNGRFFVYYSVSVANKNTDHTGILAEYLVSPGNPDMASKDEKIIMAIAEPESNHNGGQIDFGPDGYLYFALGDGGGANDEHGASGNGQNLNTLLGKILRIDVNGKPPYEIPTDNPFNGKNAKPEIWAYGLRNPWRFSFDKVTGQLFCGDVGQNKYEEVDIIEKGKNYGWRIMEGNHCFNPPENCDRTGLVLPIYEYDHSTGISITGGYMYRGKAFPSLHGKYFFADWSGKLFALQKGENNEWFSYNVIAGDHKNNDLNCKINSLGTDQDGEIYLVTQTLFGPKSPTGKIYKIIL
jgi:glucose/arabinose dehydrogenase